MSIDPNGKGAISESFDKSHLSDSFDVPAGCIRDKIEEHGLIVAHEVNERRSKYLAGEFFAAYPGNICIENAKDHVVEAIKGKEESNIRTGPYFFK